ncbi:Spore germination protein GerE [Thalassovita gelatinovora]|uniref:Spore germination protein GerE n=2 Tax=Thalassovita gelatinovora TaxID=53501 RepID=A0A0P1FXP7_THAGE|nr:Spore germination protein GerE [Thalassovita gelatinovora]SEQ24354.1 DNA-binding response regulator, NarL/FixJ family, contains REC and HTH domains [Thalassovita gelatinovora]
MHLIAIFGEGMTLSERYLDIIKQEYSAAHFIRLNSIEEANNVARSEHISFALVEQEMVADDIARGLAPLEPLGVERTVLAYRDDDIAALFYEHAHSHGNMTHFGFLPMNLQLDCWLSMLRLLFLDQCCVPNALLDMRPVAGQQRGCGEVNGLKANLTPREQEILRLVARGKQNKLIASDLVVSEHTVKLHMHNIMQKLGVRNRTEAAGIYFNGTRGVV